jgi:hypothetical protein
MFLDVFELVKLLIQSPLGILIFEQILVTNILIPWILAFLSFGKSNVFPVKEIRTEYFFAFLIIVGSMRMDIFDIGCVA